MKSIFVILLLAVSPCRAEQDAVGYADAVIPQLPVGCGYTSTIVLVNPLDGIVKYQIKFWKADGTAKKIPLKGQKEMKDSISGEIEKGGSIELTTDASTDGAPSCNGWVEITSSDILAGYVVLTQCNTLSQSNTLTPCDAATQSDTLKKYFISTTVPFGSRFANRFVVPFLNEPKVTQPTVEGQSDVVLSEGTVTTIALVNPSFAEKAIQAKITLRSSSGQELCNEVRDLKPRQQQAFVLQVGDGSATLGSNCGDKLNGVVSGTAEISTDALELSGFALRFSGISFVSFPPQRPIVQKVP